MVFIGSPLCPWYLRVFGGSRVAVGHRCPIGGCRRQVRVGHRSPELRGHDGHDTPRRTVRLPERLRVGCAFGGTLDVRSPIRPADYTGSAGRRQAMTESAGWHIDDWFDDVNHNENELQ